MECGRTLDDGTPCPKDAEEHECAYDQEMGVERPTMCSCCSACTRRCSEEV